MELALVMLVVPAASLAAGIALFAVLSLLFEAAYPGVLGQKGYALVVLPLVVFACGWVSGWIARRRARSRMTTDMALGISMLYAFAAYVFLQVFAAASHAIPEIWHAVMLAAAVAGPPLGTRYAARRG